MCSLSCSLGFTGVCSFNVERNGSSVVSVVGSSAVATVMSSTLVEV